MASIREVPMHRNQIFDFAIRSYFRTNSIVVEPGSLAHTDYHPEFTVAKRHVIHFKSALDVGKPECKTFYHLFLEWNDYGWYRYVLSKAPKAPMKKMYPYHRRLGSFLTQDKVARVRGMTVLGHTFTWDKPIVNAITLTSPIGRP